MNHQLLAHMSGPDARAIASAVLRWRWFSQQPEYVNVDDRQRTPSTTWSQELLGAKSQATADWDRAADDHHGTLVTLLLRPRGAGNVLVGAHDGVSTVSDVLALFADVPFELASFRTFWPAEWKKLGMRERGFGNQHGTLGWGCAFRGAGHDRLVSRRWLEFGPWKVWRAADDLSLVQFHDLAATPQEALRQAAPGHERMGVSDTGGFLQATDWGARLEGVYTPADRCMEVIVAGRDVTQEEMLAACFVRRARRADPDKPIERVAYVFLETAAARAHLHELWLRDLECWTVEGGEKRRLDLDYHPTPRVPDWVALLPTA